MKYPGTLILTRKDIAGLMDFSDYLRAVEEAFSLLAAGEILGPAVMDVPGHNGMFHAKGAGMPVGERVYVAVKTNGNFPENNSRFSLPTIQGTILLCDAVTGYPLAIMDSIEITLHRTAAATALAGRYLARRNATTALVCGCGQQAGAQLQALATFLALEKVFVFDQDEKRAEKFATRMSEHAHIQVDPIDHLPDGVSKSDVIVTCTTSRKFFLGKEHVRPGTFIAAVGADSHDKQEIDPALLASSKVVTDLRNQCARIGDLHHAIAANLMSLDDVHADLHQLLDGSRPGRTGENEIIVFDSTGTAIQDVASAAIAFERAVQRGAGTWIQLIAE